MGSPVRRLRAQNVLRGFESLPSRQQILTVSVGRPSCAFSCHPQRPLRCGCCGFQRSHDISSRCHDNTLAESFITAWKSGGPVLNQHGEVLGLVAWIAPKITKRRSSISRFQPAMFCDALVLAAVRCRVHAKVLFVTPTRVVQAASPPALASYSGMLRRCNVIADAVTSLLSAANYP
jgi:hypothetical protein